ncbi:MAG: DUF998 domain-containing protein [Limosilactobacillus sp.]|nr:DUF998 domain-containing protein [Limosilactobacillus sp.]
MQKFEFEVPDDVARRLTNETVEVELQPDELVMRSQAATKSLPVIKIWWYLLPAVLLGSLIFAQQLAAGVEQIPLLGRGNSIGNMVTVLGSLCSWVIFIGAFIAQKRHHQAGARQFTWRMFIPVAIAVGIVLMVTEFTIFWTIDQMFVGAQFDIYTSIILITFCFAIMNYMMINLGLTISPAIMINLMTIMMLGGVVLSMLTNGNRDWWRHNFSYLGTQRSGAAWQFNLTLILTGLLMMALTDYLFVNLRHRFPTKGVLLTRMLMYFEATCLMGVGLFPNNDRFHWLHDQIAMWLVYGLLLIIIVIRWSMPMLGHQFIHLSDAIGGVMAIEYIGFQYIHYLSLTAFELLSFGLALAWILVFFQNLESLIDPLPASFMTHLKPVPITEFNQTSNE